MTDLLFALGMDNLVCFREKGGGLFTLRWLCPRRDKLERPVNCRVGDSLTLLVRGPEYWTSTPEDKDKRIVKVGAILTPQEAFNQVCELIPNQFDLPLTPLVETGSACNFPRQLRFGCYTESIDKLLRKAFLRDGVKYPRNSDNNPSRFFSEADDYPIETGLWAPAFEGIRQRLTKEAIW